MKTELQDKILATTAGTKLGAILRCAMGRNEMTMFPRFVGKASVTSDGFVLCDFIDGSFQDHHGAFVGSKVEVLNNGRNLSLHMKLSPAEQIELLNLIDAWMGFEIIHVTGKAKG
jgi:hypothetical protein